MFGSNYPQELNRTEILLAKIKKRYGVNLLTMKNIQFIATIIIL